MFIRDTWDTHRSFAYNLNTHLRYYLAWSVVNTVDFIFTNPLTALVAKVDRQLCKLMNWGEKA